VINCGISGKPPDTNEVTKLIGQASDEAHFVHVGLRDKGDEENVVAQVARNTGQENYSFFDASDVASMQASLMNEFKPKWDWPTHTAP